MRPDVLFTCRNHFHDRITSLREEVKVHKTSLTPPLFIEVLVPSQGCELSCMFLLRVSILPLSKILIFYFGIVPTVWYFGIVPTVWYFGIVPTVWYFGIVPTVWYF